MNSLYFILEDVNKHLKIQDLNDTDTICGMYGLELIDKLQTDQLPDVIRARKVVYISLPNGKNKTIVNCKIVNEKKFVLSQFRYKLPTNKAYANVFKEVESATLEDSSIETIKNV